ncbi:MAG: peptidyl-tRNA hydrolase Pth2 [Candidatus Diapherotrites archaeon]
MAEIKQVIVVRTDLKLGKGKIASQVAHASLEAYEKVVRERPDWAKLWNESGKAKVVLKVQDEKSLVELYNKAKAVVPSAIIKDAGLTQVDPGTITCFASGPAPSEKLDALFSKLKLL